MPIPDPTIIVLSLEPIKFRVLGHSFKRHGVFIEARISRDGETRWVCTTDSNATLNLDGDFEYEPIPSNRDTAYVERTRFATAEAALQNFARHMPNFEPHW